MLLCSILLVIVYSGLFSSEVWLLNDEKGGAELLNFRKWKQNR